jgi:hypothetical protein
MNNFVIARSEDVLVLERLQSISVGLWSEWDTLVFLYRHPASLGTAAQIARLIGYDNSEIAAALHRLEALGLIQRSRDSRGIRLYQLSEPRHPSPNTCLHELMSLAQHRTGRLLLSKHLKRP